MPTDDWGGVAVNSQPKTDDWGGVPVTTPKVPDLSGVQKMTQENLAANDNKEQPEGAEPKPQQSPMERLETGTGLPVQKIISGSAQPFDINQANRGAYITALKDGSVTNGEGWLQSYFYGVGNAVQQGGEKWIGQMVYPFISDEHQQKLIQSGIVPPEGGAPLSANAALSARILHGLSEGISPISAPVGAYWTLPVSFVSPLINPAVEKTSEALPSPYKSIPADILNIVTTGLGAAGIHYADSIRTAAATKLNMESSAVTPEHVDQVIAEGSKNLFPAANDFESVATATGLKIDDLRNVYEKTGVKPDQVFKDMQSNPAIANDIMAGKIPKDYIHLIQDVMTPENAEETLHPKPVEGIHSDVEQKVSSMTDEEKSLRLSMLNKKMQEAIITPREMLEHDALLPTKELPPDIANAMARMEALREESPPINLSKEGASASSNPFTKIFNPVGMSESSKDMATALRQGRGPENRDIAVIQDSLQEHAKTFANMNDQDRLKFIDYIENRSGGAKLDNAQLQGVADAIKDIYNQVANKIQERFPNVGLRQDYFTHQYKDQAAAKKFFSDWVAKQGTERHLQTRTFPTLSEAMAAGLKPKTTNPIETVMNYVNNMGNLMAAHRTVELAREHGIAEYFNKGQQPDGWIPLEGNLADETAIPQGTNSGTPIKTGKILYAPEDAARVYNNDVSKGVTGPAGDILDNIQRMNNFANKLVLGLSGYHFTATSMASMASDVGRMEFNTPVGNVIRGGKYIDAYLGRGDLSPELQKALDVAIRNNTINVRQQDYWKAGPAKDYVDIFKNGSAATELKTAAESIKQKPITGTVGVIATEIGRTMDTVSKPLFDYYIPRIKIAANIDELHNWLEKHPDATPEMQDMAAQEIGNSIDNRFGEMMRDNLFWHAITKQTLQTALLSYSWVTGAARMLKGIPDAGQFILGQKELSSSARYLFGMAATYAAVNGVRTYIGTGKPPDDIMDFIYPRTGGITAQGRDERELLPSHIGQYTNYLHEGIGELGNEASPGLKLIYHLLANSDRRGLPITNKNNEWFGEQRWDDYAHYVLHEETPIGLQSFIQGNKKGSQISIVERLLGARQAPRYITDEEGYKEMMKHINDEEYKKKERSDKKIQQQYEGNP